MNDNTIPILFLKTKTCKENDPYQKNFSVATRDGVKFEPIFVPAMEHNFKEEGLDQLRKILHRRRIGKEVGSKYGGLIFTSQRAVEALALLIKEGVEKGSGDHHDWPYLQDVPIYSVGPATTRALKAIPLDRPLNIYGTETGCGESLALFIMSHYTDWYRDWDLKCPLVFVAGEKRQDIIPKTLINHIPLVELEIYETSIIPSFGQNLIDHLIFMKDRKMIWVVIFSPSVGEETLRILNMLDPETNRVRDLTLNYRKRKMFFATIGPTTRDYLFDTFNFDVDVCAKKPCAEGIKEGIMEFIRFTY